MPIYKRGLQGISYLPQEPSVFRGMNVEDNLLLIIEIVEQDKNKHDIILQRNLLNEFDISHVENQNQLSSLEVKDEDWKLQERVLPT